MNDEQRRVLDEARAASINYGVDLVRSPAGRTVVVLGEIHLKPRRAAALGERIVNAFPLRGVESFQADQVLMGRISIGLVHAWYMLIRVVTLGLLKGSTITYARSRKTGRTVLLERTDHVPLALHAASVHLALIFGTFLAMLVSAVIGVTLPFVVTLLLLLEAHIVLALPLAILLRKRKWGWVVLPIMGILTARDELMAWGTVKMLENGSGEDPALVIMGRAHMRGFVRELVTKYGFTSSGAARPT